jgi:hypothetical protein
VTGPYTGRAGSRVTFAATVTVPHLRDSEGGFTDLWSFGDGSTNSQFGPDTVKLTVTWPMWRARS